VSKIPQVLSSWTPRVSGVASDRAGVADQLDGPTAFPAEAHWEKQLAIPNTTAFNKLAA
jgi:hypothetical protein